MKTIALCISLLSATSLGLELAQGRGFERVYVFKTDLDGIAPRGGLVTDKAGNLYGTTAGGGASGLGTAFRLSLDGTETKLHDFAGPPIDGSAPIAGLIMDKKGNLYGTTAQGGGSKSCAEFGCGTVFKIGADGKESVLHSFDPAKGDGSDPLGGVVADSEGDLYGTTAGGGGSGCEGNGCGTVFKITANGGETILHSFGGYPDDGSYPSGDLIVDSSGNVYGTTQEGGSSNSCEYGCGTVFEIAPDGAESLLHSFSGDPDGCTPYAGLVRDDAGNLYGTTTDGGAGYGCNSGDGGGIVFELASDGTETVLHTFGGGSDGYFPYAALIADKMGNFYGTTTAGGGAGGQGTVFKVSPEGTETVLHSFSVYSDGRFPFGPLVRGASGHLFGTTAYGGKKCAKRERLGCGTVFGLQH